MKFAEIMAALIRSTIARGAISTHERMLFQGYSEDTAKDICRHLLGDNPASTTIGLPEDTGSMAKIHMRAASVDAPSDRVELIPFVVVERPRPEDPPWIGSQGFASRLRTSFPLLVEKGVNRVLVLFDNKPVETEQTTASQSLTRSVESLDSLFRWLRGPEWRSGFAPEVYDATIAVLGWAHGKLREEPQWSPEPIERVFERTVAFFMSCRSCDAVEQVGQNLSLLGLLFDDDILYSEPWESRINRNAEIASQLDAIRRQRILDPLAEAESLLDLGSPNEDFYEKLLRALRSRGLVTAAEITLGEVEDRLRSRERRPAWLDVQRLQCVSIDSDGTAEGSSLEWRLLSDFSPPPERNDPVHVVVPCPSASVRLTFPVDGDLRAFLYRDGTFFSAPHDQEGALTPGTPVTVEVSRPTYMDVLEFVVREKKPGRGRPPRPTQIIRLGVIAGPHAIAPEGAALDADSDAFLVDGSADSLTVQVGPTEVRVEDDLPPEDGTTSEIEVSGITFRWAGEDRDPANDHDRTARTTLRLLEIVGLRNAGDPTAGQPYLLDSGQIGATYRSSAVLDVPAAWLKEEAELLGSPSQFVGLGEDTPAAETELRRTVPAEFNAWLAARVAFFEAVRTASEDRLQGTAGPCTVYLAPFHDPAFESLAAAYVDRYTSLITAAAAHAAANANRALLEPLLLCDRAYSSEDGLRIAPTHPAAVAILGALQRGLLRSPWPSVEDQQAIEALLDRPLLNGLLPWLVWRKSHLVALQDQPLLWRVYGTTGGSLDSSDELAPIVVQKVRRLLSLAPHLNRPGQSVFLNVEIGKGSGSYLLHALDELYSDQKIRCSFDVAVIADRSRADLDPIRLFGSTNSSSEEEALRHRLHGFARVRSLGAVAEREAHLVFRMEAAKSSKVPFASMSRDHPLARSTGFAAGLAQEPARFADAKANEVVYTRYLAGPHQLPEATGDEEGLWGGIWRNRYIRLSAATQNAAVGLHSATSSDSVPSQSLRQIADGNSAAEYGRSFITVHCDPAQGPEFFVGARTTRSGVFLVESSDRGSPELPGRDIVSVTSRIEPFRAALGAAVGGLPAPLNQLVDAEVAKGLLRDINLLRGTEVFHFLREISQRSHVHLMDGLDNVLALRFLLSEKGGVPGYLPIVLAMDDITARSRQLSDLRKGTKCDDIIVVYIPRKRGSRPELLYRLVEVKFGERSQGWAKAKKQLSATANRLNERVPTGLWKDDPSVSSLLLERDIAWALHEALERYRAFELLPPDDEMEGTWALKHLFEQLHGGNFKLLPYRGVSTSSEVVTGTALMLDPSIPGSNIATTMDGAVEYVTLPRDVIGDLLVRPAERLANPQPGSSSQAEPASERDSEARKGALGGAGHQGQPMEGGDEARSASVNGPMPNDEQETGLDGQTPQATRDDRGGHVASPAGPSSDPTVSDPGASNAKPSEGVPDENADEPKAEAQARLAHRQAEIDEIFRGFIGNDGTVRRLKRMLAIAAVEDRSALDPIGLFGPKSTGKTELARRISRALDLPRIELSETILKSADDLASRLQEQADNAGTPFRMDRDEYGATVLIAPPMVVFIDEVHLLRPRVQESLLKALEPDDRTLLSNHGTIDTGNITFVIATTDPGDLGSAFKSRISRFELREYSLSEIVGILKAHRAEREDVPEAASRFSDECLEIFARVGRLVPRQAIRLLKEAARAVNVGLLAPEPAALRSHYWAEHQSDRLGLTDVDRGYLRLLFPDHTFGLDSLAAQLGLGKTTISGDIEPYLLRLGLIQRSPGGRKLTQKGRELISSAAASEESGS